MKSKTTSKHQLNLSNFWIRNGLIILALSLIVNHLFDAKYFPTNPNYRFPFIPVMVSVISGLVVILIARLNFNHYKHKYFAEKIDTKTLLRFLLTTLGYITLFYLPLYFGLNGLINGVESYSMYHLLTGLSLTLLICAVGISLLFSIDVYQLHKLVSISGHLKVEYGGKITLVNYADIAYIYSRNKIVYIVKTDGTEVATDFTLNELEEKISPQTFYRANRQTIIHLQSIEQVESIENGKLSVILKLTQPEKKPPTLNISRYKKQEFMNWFKGKL